MDQQPTSLRQLSPLNRGVRARKPHWVPRGWWPSAGEARLDRVPALSGGAGHLTLKNLGCPVCKMGLHLPLGVTARTRATSYRAGWDRADKRDASQPTMHLMKKEE